MPCTPTMPLPATVTIAWPRTIASALTGYVVHRAARRHLGARRVARPGTTAPGGRCACRRSESGRADGAPWRRSARPRPPRGDGAAGSAGRPAPAAGRRSGCPRTSFHSTTLRAPSGRRQHGRGQVRPAAAERVGLPSGGCADEARHDRGDAAGEERRGAPAGRAASVSREVRGRRRRAGRRWRRSRPRRRRPRRGAAARQHRGEDGRRHPFAARHEHVAGARRRRGRAPRSAPHSSRYSRAAASIVASRARRAGPAGSERLGDFTMPAQERRRDPGATRRPCPARASAAPLEQQIGDPAERRGDDHERAGVAGDERRGALDGASRRPATRRRTSRFRARRPASPRASWMAPAPHRRRRQRRDQAVDRPADGVVVFGSSIGGLACARDDAGERAACDTRP